MTAASAKSRDATWDVARGIGMALVIYGHLVEPIWGPVKPGKPFIEAAFVQWQVIYAFHMPLFFLISGVVNRNLAKKTWPEVLKGSLRLLCLAWIVHIIGEVAALALGYNPDAARSAYGVAEAIVDPIIEGQGWSIGVLWFLTSLCFVQLLAYAILRHFASIWVAVLAAAVGVGAMYAENYFLFRTWFPGLAFFALGYLLAQRRVTLPYWLWVPLLPALILLAPLNTGCHFTLAQTCFNVPQGFGVWMFAGFYGFIPLFYLTALVGSLAVLSLSRGLAKFKPSQLLAYMGRESLNLFIVNGFVAVFVTPYLSDPNFVVFPNFNTLQYVGLFVGIIALHLGALQVLKPLLDLIDRGAVTIAGFLSRLIAGEAKERAQAA